MGRKRIAMDKIKEVIRMRSELNLSERQIARALRMSRPVVAKYTSAFKISGLSFADLKNLETPEIERRLNLTQVKNNRRFQTLENKFSHYVTELTRVGVTKFTLWEEYKEEHPNGYSYSQFCEHFKHWQNSSKLDRYNIHKAGDKAFCDYAGEKIPMRIQFHDEIQKFEVFVSVLGASKIIYSEPAISQKIDDWLSVNHNAFHYFGGVPKAIVPDCLKSGVTKGHRYEPDINPTYADFAEHYDTVILPARPYKPKDKAIVENAVRMVYRNIYAPLRNKIFHSFDEFKEAFRERLNIMNSKKMQHLNLSRFEFFEKVEKEVLKPLPPDRYEKKEFKRLLVRPNYHIFFNEDKHFYSVPYKFRNRHVKVAYTAENIEIYCQNVRISFFKRSKEINGFTTNPDHRPPNHRYLDEWTPQNFIDKAKKIGPNAEKFIHTVLLGKKHPEQAYKICAGILSLSAKYGNDRLEKACGIGVDYQNFSYKGVHNILKHGMENKKEEVRNHQYKLPVHENIRGKEYYTLSYNLL